MVRILPIPPNMPCARTHCEASLAGFSMGKDKKKSKERKQQCMWSPRGEPPKRRAERPKDTDKAEVYGSFTQTLSDVGVKDPKTQRRSKSCCDRKRPNCTLLTHPCGASIHDCATWGFDALNQIDAAMLIWDQRGV